jgi:hypothetical protein
MCKVSFSDGGGEKMRFGVMRMRLTVMTEVHQGLVGEEGEGSVSDASVT